MLSISEQNVRVRILDTPPVIAYTISGIYNSFKSILKERDALHFSLFALNMKGMIKSMEEKNEQFFSRQIAVYKTSKSLLEFLDSMKPASVYNYAKIHAGTGGEGEMWKGNKLKSRIKLRIGYYAEKPAKYAECNLEPWEIKYLYECCKQQLVGEIISQTKIIGAAKGEDGRSPVTKVSISRLLEEKGVPRKLPWKIVIENGTGIAKTTTTGGTACQSGSYVSEKSLQVALTDYEMFKHLSQVVAYIEAWELANGARLIKEHDKAEKERYLANKQVG